MTFCPGMYGVTGSRQCVIYAMSGINPGLIGEKAWVVMAAEDDCKRLAEFETSAQRFTLEQT